MDKAWASIRRAVSIGDPEPYDRYFGCQHVEFNNVTLPRKAPPLLMYLILNRLLPHRPNIAPMLFGNMTPSTKLGQGIIFSHVRSFSSLAMSGGKFAKSWHPQRVTIPDKNVEFKGLPVLNMHFSDENSAAVEDDMTIDQKIQTIDFGRVEPSSGMVASQVTLVSSPYPRRTDLAHIGTKGMPRMTRKLNGSRALTMSPITSLVV